MRGKEWGGGIKPKGQGAGVCMRGGGGNREGLVF